MPIAAGLDIGNSKCVVATSTNAVADALLNENSARETPALVHFARTHRLFGTAAAQYVTASPASTISHLKRLLGCRFDDPSFQKDSARLPFETAAAADGGISIRLTYLDEPREFTVVEMLAMLLAHLRRNAERSAGESLSDCVIGVPAYFTEQQRQAYRDASLIAGWKPHELLHEGIAAALEYRANRGNAAGDSVVAFVDIGHCDTQITVARYEGSRLQVVAEKGRPDLGGRDFDEVIFNYFARMFKGEYGINVISDGRASARLWTACEKAKKVLSANTEAHIGIDALIGGMDVSGVITREKFEKMSSKLPRRIVKLFLKTLGKANMDVGAVDSVELVGSGSRIPAIALALAENLGKRLSRTLNGSEFVACACARECEKLLGGGIQDRDVETEVKGRGRGRSWSGSSRTSFLSKAINQEKNLAQQDMKTERAKEKRNILEAYIYKSRKKYPRKKGTNDRSERNTITRKLTEVEEWLYEEGDVKSEEVYMDKLQELKLLVSPEVISEVKGIQPQSNIELSGTSLKSSRELKVKKESLHPVSTGTVQMGTTSDMQVSSDCHNSNSQRFDHTSTNNRMSGPQTGIEMASASRVRQLQSQVRPSRQLENSSRDNQSVEKKKKRLKRLHNRIPSICKCKETDAKSPSRSRKGHVDWGRWF